MNVGGITVLAIIIVFAIGGIFIIASNVGSTPYVDYHGNTTDNKTNATQAVMGNITPVATTTGGWMFLFAVVLILLTAGGACVYLVTKNSGGSNYRPRY